MNGPRYVRNLLVIWGVAALAACGAVGAGQGDGDAGAGAADAGENGDAGEVVTPPGVLGFFISPLTTTLRVVNDQPATVELRATAVYANGRGVVVDGAQWTADRPHIARVDGRGVVTAYGEVAGDVRIRAVWRGLSAEAFVRAEVEREIELASPTPDERAKLEAGGPADGSVAWQYPYDATVFPRGLRAPMMMWGGATAGDLYRVAFESEFMKIVIYAQAEPPSRLELPAAAWLLLTESGTGGDVQVDVRRLSAGAVTTLAEHTWRIASGSMRGVVYYWSVTNGRVVRIKPGADAPDDFLAAAGVTDGCTTCHTVSADGSTLVMGQGEEEGDSQANTFDLKKGELVLSGQGRAWANPAVSPNGTYLVRNHSVLPGYPGQAGGDGVFETRTGAKVSGTTGLEGRYLGMPAFAPDGRSLAFTTLPSPGGLSVFDYDATGPSFTNERKLVDAGEDPATRFIAWPTLTPDGKAAIYVRSDRIHQYARRYPAWLYMASTETGEEVRLSRLNGDDYPFAAGDLDRAASYEPTLAPVAAGGYFWVVFTSRRTYGSVRTYQNDPHAIQQLWIAAIDQAPKPGVDPSHPAFWLPGQEVTTKNMRGFFALEPCHGMGETCGAASECCSQICLDGVCEAPGVGQCSPAGAACRAHEDCCGQGFVCINMHCAEPHIP